MNRPAWAPSWATEADVALLAEREPFCWVCAKTEGLTRWLRYRLTSCPKHGPTDANQMTEKETDQLKDQDE